MFVPWTWTVDATRILTRRELATVLQSLRRQAERRESARMNLAIVRFACCCGLRAPEIAGLTLDTVQLVPGRPHLRIRATTAKGGRGRRVPLWWDAGTLADLDAWKATRLAQRARGASPFVCALQGSRRGDRLKRHAVRERFLTACKALGLPRVRTLTIHHGRHTFVGRHWMPE